MPSSSLLSCCGCTDEGQADSDPYSVYGDTMQMIDAIPASAKARAQLAVEARRGSVTVDGVGDIDDGDLGEGSMTSLQRLQRASPFQGVTPCPNMLFVQGQDARSCSFCNEAFGVRKLKHHCRLCGLVFHRGRCSRKETLTPSQTEPVTVCAFCYGYYTQYRLVMQKGRKFIEYGRNRSSVNRSVMLTAEGDTLLLGQPVHIPSKSREQHIRETAQISEIKLTDIGEITTAYPSGAFLGFSDGMEGPAIKISTATRSLLIGLESADEQRLWLDGLRAAVHVAKSTHRIAESSSEPWRRDSLNILKKRRDDRAKKMLGYSMARDRWSSSSPRPESGSPHREPPQPQPQHSQNYERQLYTQTTDGMSPPGPGKTYDRQSVSSGGGGIASSDGASPTMHHCSDQMLMGAPSDMAQAVVEMEMSEHANGQKKHWTVRATSSANPAAMPHQKQANTSTASSHQLQPLQQQQQQQRRQSSSPMMMAAGRDGMTPSPSLASPPSGSTCSSGITYEQSSARPRPRSKGGPPRPPLPVNLERHRASPLAPPPPAVTTPADQQTEEAAIAPRPARDSPVGAILRGTGERLSARFRPRPTSSPGPKHAPSAPDSSHLSPLASPPPMKHMTNLSGHTWVTSPTSSASSSDFPVPMAATSQSSAAVAGGSVVVPTDGQDYATEDD